MTRQRLEKFIPVYRFGRALFRFLFCTLYGEREVGLGNVPDSGPCIVAANHVSLLDPPLVGAAICTRQVWFMAKKELFLIPILGPLIGACGCFFVDRQAKDGKSINQGLELLQQGKIVGIFPEGTRSKDGKLKQGKAGVALLALKSGVPVIPAAVFNTKVIADRKMLPGKSVGIRFGPPIYVEKEDNPSRERLREVINQVMSAIAKLQEQGFPTLEEVQAEGRWAKEMNTNEKKKKSPDHRKSLN